MVSTAMLLARSAAAAEVSGLPGALPLKTEDAFSPRVWRPPPDEDEEALRREAAAKKYDPERLAANERGWKAWEAQHRQFRTPGRRTLNPKPYKMKPPIPGKPPKVRAEWQDGRAAGDDAPPAPSSNSGDGAGCAAAGEPASTNGASSTVAAEPPHSGGGGAGSAFAAEKPMGQQQRKLYRDKVRAIFTQAFDAYMAHAFPLPELKPISCSSGGFDPCELPMLTLVDALDTLAVLGNDTQFALAVETVAQRATAPGFFDLDLKRDVSTAQLRSEARCVGIVRFTSECNVHWTRTVIDGARPVRSHRHAYCSTAIYIFKDIDSVRGRGRRVSLTNLWEGSDPHSCTHMWCRTCQAKQS